MSGNAGNGSNLLIQYSTETSTAYDSVATWSNASTAVGKIQPTGGDRQTESYNTFGSKIISSSDGGPININMDVVFLNAAGEFLELLIDRFLGQQADGTAQTDRCLWIRWAYQDGAEGAKRYAALCEILSNPLPGGDANSAQPVVVQCNMSTNFVERDTVPVTP